MNVRTRIAPSPTGYLHVGTAHTALFNYLFAKHSSGVFILRIDDTDPLRSKKEYEDSILRGLKLLGIKWDEGADIGGPYGPYRQSERIGRYRQYIDQLLKQDKAYYCFCTPEELEKERKEQKEKKIPTKYSGKCSHLTKQQKEAFQNEGRKPVVRFRTPQKRIVFRDMIRGDIDVDASLFGDFVIARSDGSALLNFAATVDDIEMKITHVIRGEDFLNLTPRQLLLTEALGHPIPQFAHLSFLYAPDRTKLSKRHGATSVTEYIEMGILPEALVNYLMTLGWSMPKDTSQAKPTDLFGVKEAVLSFTIEAVQKSAPIFDIEKLRWMNGEYIRAKSDKELKELIYQHLSILTREHDALVDKIIPLVKERMKTLAEFMSLAGFFFERPKAFERPLKDAHLKVGRVALESCAWNHDAMEKSIRDAADTAKLKARDLFMEIRIAVTGKTVGPPLLESLEILGKEEILERLNSKI
ncbi:glutamate--tRNA ligase [Patescibacteria group bacterium]|nr:glutamate--tRNA ligase [Patescibacteria group bacterium]MBU1472248.1 glutamate--tRNA ligase [Patescibacteria group bacterium]MBU2460501.1 glutamate--tRNA ligase [Patescibacteria group bacterium]MBU2543872.1 glutamate--tRNA ligase [Patescibacteria group bacterium]